VIPGITIFQSGASVAVSDPSVAYDALHGQWIIASIGVVQDDASGNPLTEQVLVSRSPDGVNWGGPIAVNPVGFYDKDWIVLRRHTYESFSTDIVTFSGGTTVSTGRALQRTEG